MILKNILDISTSINSYRLILYELTKHKDLCDPDVIKISQRLDREIITLQKLIYTRPPINSEHLCKR
ncbi:aspartyl-phosphate phosphatase Spo0E family protein [Priestia megaterium]|uniref:aspartyl-phosphate phosphatase Spo0E family protein n=1 Tax=Priestia megaterium TaxID=1404 RepID=UPI000D5216DD|nr:aspartyl-phosphate phosphatase Spo0E family protein [Priestia megaterium]PVE64477.1 hypothetical protein DC428_23570 [Priestia megaterium]PVE79857.1 hypothetical protein DC421_24050 [Priestia megaterium]PVE83764.1 hypothetical protein DC426_20155 [Priestia megaterium]PVE99558.1 hypothetical protein DC433_13095 [Priestia megaterium]